ncbi:MAG: biotin/lipoyl-binding protein [Proteobacteria bacterium]|nr:biotin/lipoyl-binding protein [Pseudomonadota bacterium]
MRARNLVIAAFLLGAPAWLSPPGAAAQETGALVQVDAVKREPLSQRFTVIGRLVARQRGMVAARVEGPVAELRVQIGDRVRAGEVLAVIDRDRLKWHRAAAAAAGRSARTAAVPAVAATAPRAVALAAAVRPIPTVT